MGVFKSTASVFLQWTARRNEAGEVVGVEEAAASPEEDMFFLFWCPSRRRSKGEDGE